MGKTCVCGAEELDVDTKGRKMTAPGGVVVEEGDVISIDGTSGDVYLGEVAVVPSPVVQYFEGELDPASADADDLVRAVHRLMQHADANRRMRVRANADTSEDADRARRMGAEGIGLCRTEHMFLGDRKQYVERLILAESDEEKKTRPRGAAAAAAQGLRAHPRGDGRPSGHHPAARPAAARVPARPHRARRARRALPRPRGEHDENDLRLLQAVNRLHEQNPMLGLRGVRLGLVIPGLFALQVRAIAEAACFRQRMKGDPQAEIMIPLVGSVQELELIRDEAAAVLKSVADDHGCTLDVPLRDDDRAAARRAHGRRDRRVRRVLLLRHERPHPDHVGLQPRRRRGGFFSNYLEKGVFGVSPFESLDVEGVGALVRIAVEKGRADAARHPPRRLRRARRRPRQRPLLPRGRAWTTCPAPRSGCRWRGWRPVGPPCSRRSTGSDTR